MTTLMADAPSRLADDRAPAALRFVHELLQGARKRPAGELLAEIVEIFAAQDAGLAAPLADLPIVQERTNLNGVSDLPWEKDPSLLSQVRAAPAAVSLQGERSWLLTAVFLSDAAPWLLWLEDTASRQWTPGECAAFALAGQALGRVTCLSQHADEAAALRRRMEQTAAVTGRLAHDFGNVLTGILGFAELSLGQTPPESPSRPYLREVLESARHGAGWVRKLQTFSRRKRAPSAASTLAEAVAETGKHYREAWGGSIALLVTLADPLPPVAVDRHTVTDVLRELLDNARDAISGQGVVTVSARAVELRDGAEVIGDVRPGPHVELTITDTGCGFPLESRRRLFKDVFFSTKNRQRGIGLALVYAHLAACGAGFRFGPDPEQGTAVRVYLPVAPQTPTPATTKTGPNSPAVLVVDDDPMVLGVICKLLTHFGYRAQGTSEPARAVELCAAAAEPFALVISDVAMPGMSGHELARLLRKHQPRSRFLFISGQGDDSPSTTEQLPDFPLLKKPFPPQALLQAVSAALAHEPTTAISSNHC